MNNFNRLGIQPNVLQNIYEITTILGQGAPFLRNWFSQTAVYLYCSTRLILVESHHISNSVGIPFVFSRKLLRFM